MHFDYTFCFFLMNFYAIFFLHRNFNPLRAMFFQVLGIAFFGLIVISAVGGSVLLWKGRYLHKIRASLQGSPSEVTLVKDAKPMWIRHPRAQSAIRILEHLGFEKGDCYRVSELSGVRLMGLCCPTDHILAVLHRHDGMGVFVELSVFFPTGEEITVTDAPHGEGMETRPGVTRIYMKKVRVQDLVLEIRKRVMHRIGVSVSNERFAEIYEAAYRKEMEWRNARGGVSEKEVSQVVASVVAVPSAGEVQVVMEDSKLSEILRWESDVLNYLRHSEDLSVGQWTTYEASMLLFSESFHPKAYVHYLAGKLGIGEWLIPYYLELTGKMPLSEVLRSVVADQRGHMELLAHIEAPIQAQIFGIKRPGEGVRTALRLKQAEPVSLAGGASD